MPGSSGKRRGGGGCSSAVLSAEVSAAEELYPPMAGWIFGGAKARGETSAMPLGRGRYDRESRGVDLRNCHRRGAPRARHETLNSAGGRYYLCRWRVGRGGIGVETSAKEQNGSRQAGQAVAKASVS